MRMWRTSHFLKKQNAGVADEPFPQKTKCRCGGTADALVSGSSEEIRVGSNPVIRTKKEVTFVYQKLLLFYPLRKRWHIITL